MTNLLEDLSFRGLIQQMTDEEGLNKQLNEEKSACTQALTRQQTACTSDTCCLF